MVLSPRAAFVGGAACLVLALGSGATAAPSAPRGGEAARTSRFAVGLYYLPRPTCDPKKTLERWLRPRKDLVLRPTPSSPAPAGPWVGLMSPPIADFAPPDEKSLSYFARGLSPEQKLALRGSESVSLLVFESSGAAALATYRASIDLGGFMAKECGGVLWDDEARLAFSPAAWAERSKGWSADGLPDVSGHIAIHMYRDGELVRMITLGMVKLGVPDVVINQVPSTYAAMESVIRLLCQRMVEGARPLVGRDFELAVSDVRHPAVRKELEKLSRGNARGRAVIHLAAGAHDKGDPENPLLEVVFPGPPRERQVRQADLLAELFGGNDRVIKVRDDAVLLAASARARKKALGFKPRYASGPPQLDTLQVKAPFRTASGSTEWMWVEVVRWQGSTIHGVLRNDPVDVPGLKTGARVDVDESSIFDYILTHPDGSREGNETQALIDQGR